ncbi:MAG: hypothetical protein KIT60_07035 [Burkholderiaceae bacterium]|nr:hypothetical protein [Burkholderiaceae bacterium]
MSCIAYSDGYEYQLRADCRVELWELRLERDVALQPWLELSGDGWLLIRAGYAWDGPSGPAIDTPSFMRGSLVHDALYQLMRDGVLEEALHRAPADQALRRLCIEDGMWRLRAWWVYQGVRLFGKPHADPELRKPWLRAPEGCTP